MWQLIEEIWYFVHDFTVNQIWLLSYCVSGCLMVSHGHLLSQVVSYGM